MNIRLLAVTIFVLLFTITGFGQNARLRKKRVNNIEIKGNRVFSEGKIKSMLFTKEKKWYAFLSKRKYSESDVKYDIETIRKFYGRNGYPFTRATGVAMLSPKDTSKVQVTFTIDEGKKVYLSSVQIRGGLPRINTQLKDYIQKIKTGEPINTELIKASVYRIKNLYADNAYPIADVSSELEYSPDSSYVDVAFLINPGTYVLNGDIEIAREGSDKSKEFILRRELVIEKGKPYDRRKMIESQQRLYSTGLLRFVTLRRTLGLKEIESDTSVTDFRLVINERKPLFINGKIGAGQDDDFGAVFSTSASVGHRNLWGTGRKLILTGSISLQFTQRGEENVDSLEFKDLFSKSFWRDIKLQTVKNAVELDYVEPWFLGYRMPLSLSTEYKIRNKNPLIGKFYDQISGEMQLSRELNLHTNISFSARVEFVDIHDIKSDEQEIYRKNGDNSIRRRLSFYGQRDTRDNLLAPQKGIFSYVALDYVGDVLGGDFSYIKGEFYWSGYKNLDGSNILAMRFNTGVLEELAIDGSSSDDRFTLGGAKTIRGFAENDLGVKWGLPDVDSTQSLYGQPKGGKLMMLANLELRRTLFWRFGGTAFLDAGNVFYNVKEFKLNRIELVGGLGIQFFTPIGPIRLDRGVRIRKPFDLADGATHLTILYAF